MTSPYERCELLGALHDLTLAMRQLRDVICQTNTVDLQAIMALYHPQATLEQEGEQQRSGIEEV